jgi:hypothetical protein
MPMTPDEFAKKYKMDQTFSFVKRLAMFLNDGADHLPHRWFDKSAVARVVFGLARAPAEDSDWVTKKLSNLTGRARDFMIVEFERTIISNPVHGIRASVDSSDTRGQEGRKKDIKLRSMVKSAKKTDSIIKIGDLPQEMKEEVLATRVALKTFEKAVGQLPLLPVLTENHKKK